MSLVVQKERSPRVLELRLNRPGKRNALNAGLIEELTDRLSEAANSDAVRVVVLAAEGSAFCAGADLDDLRALQSASDDRNEADSRAMAQLFKSIISNPKPLIARVQGPAIAGGCGLVAACDFAIASEDARFGFTEVRIGFVPAIVTAVVSNRLRGSDLRDLLLTGDIVAASDAERIGLVKKVVALSELDEEVDTLADRLNSVSGEAIAMTKKLLADTVGLRLDEALREGRRVNVEARGSADCLEGISAFLEKRSPAWVEDER